MNVVGTLVRGFAVFKVVVAVVGLVGVAHHNSADLTGKWQLTLEMEVGRATPALDLVEKDGKLSGTYTGRYGSSPVDGTIDGRKLKFTVSLETTALVFTGELKDDGTLAGTADFGEMGRVAWKAERARTFSR